MLGFPMEREAYDLFMYVLTPWKHRLNDQMRQLVVKSHAIFESNGPLSLPRFDSRDNVFNQS